MQNISNDVVIVGAGPYGLSLAAHLEVAGVPHRIFGPPMQTWREQMPRGMFLKSDGFASNLFRPAPNEFSFKTFCTEQQRHYADLGWPVPLSEFAEYGIYFQQKFVPHLDTRLVRKVECDGKQFLVTLGDGEQVPARAVVVAAGITHFPYMPPLLRNLGEPWATHSSAHADPAQWSGKRVAVIGAGASAQQLATLMHEAGVDVTLIARRRKLVTHRPPPPHGRSLRQRMRHPETVIGPGWRSWLAVHLPRVFRQLPARLRIFIVKKHLGPAGGWFLHNRLAGKVKIWTGCDLRDATVRDGQVHLRLACPEGERSLSVDHVVAATGFLPAVDSLPFLPDDLRASIKRIGSSPELSRNFESSTRGLYFIGPAAANSFGPLMRFACGAEYAARRLTRTLRRVAAISHGAG